MRTAADQTGSNFDFTAWAKQPVLNGQSPEALAASGNETWTAFERALDRIERMIGGGSPVDELLGLPLEEVAAAAREEARRTQERIERERAEREAVLADARRSSLENEALRLLDRDAEAWLGQIDDNGRTPLDLAARSPADLTQITQVLHRRWREREEAARQAELAASSLEKLFRAARKVFDERLAWLFIDSGQPRLGNRSPRSVCRDETGLKACLALLPRKRQRDTL